MSVALLTVFYTDIRCVFFQLLSMSLLPNGLTQPDRIRDFRPKPLSVAETSRNPPSQEMMSRSRRWMLGMLPFLLISLALLFVAAALHAMHPESAWIPSFSDIKYYFKDLARKPRESLNFDDRLLFFILVVLATMACLPVTPFEIAAGYIFGWGGLKIALPAKVLGSIISFTISRFCWFDLVRAALRGNVLFTALEVAFSQNEWKVLFLVRAMYLPQGIKNYGIGVLNVRLSVFTVATSIVSSLYSVAFTYIGVTSENLARELRGGGLLSVVILGIGLGLGIVGMIWMSALVKSQVNRLGTYSPIDTHEERRVSADS